MAWSGYHFLYDANLFFLQGLSVSIVKLLLPTLDLRAACCNLQSKGSAGGDGILSPPFDDIRSEGFLSARY